MPRQRFGSWIACWMVAVVAVAGVAPILAAAGVQSGDDPVAPDDRLASVGSTSTASFAVGELTEHRGDVVWVKVQLHGTAKATFRIAGDDYEATAVVEDWNGDDEIAIRIDTHRLGRGTPKDGIVAAGIDDATVADETQVDGGLDAGEYRLGVVGAPVPNFTRPNDEATLHLEAPSAPSVSVAVAPAGTDLGSLSAIERARAEGRLRNGSAVPWGGRLVLRVEAPGIAGRVTDTGNATAGVLELFESDDANLVAEQTPRTTQPEIAPVTLDGLPAAASTVVANPNEDVYYFVFDTPDLRSAIPSDSLAELERGRLPSGFRTSLTVDDRTSDGTVFTLVGRDAYLDHRNDGNFVYRRPVRAATVDGATTLFPGTTLTVDLSIPGEPNRTKTVTVRENPKTDDDGRPLPGRFAATFDLSAIPDGVELTAVVRADGERLDEVRIRVDDPEADLRFADQSTGAKAAGVVSVANVSLSRPGFVAVHRGSVGGPLLGHSRVLEPGEYPRVNVRDLGIEQTGSVRLVAVVYRDVDGDGALDPDVDRPFSVHANPVSDAASVRIRPASTDGTTTTTGTTARDTTTTVTTAADGDTTTTTVDGDTTTPSTVSDPLPVPGFGVGIALVAILLGVAATARRRR